MCLQRVSGKSVLCLLPQILDKPPYWNRKEDRGQMLTRSNDERRTNNDERPRDARSRFVRHFCRILASPTEWNQHVISHTRAPPKTKPTTNGHANGTSTNDAKIALLPTPSSTTSPCTEHGSKTRKTSTSRSRATLSLSSRDSTAPGNLRSPSTPSTPRASPATSKRSPPTPASSSTRWSAPKSIPSTASAPPSPSSRRPPAAALARPSAPSPKSTITCACSTPPSDSPTARTAAS